MGFPKTIGLLAVCAILFCYVSACSNAEPAPDPAQPLVIQMQISEPGVYRVTNEMLHEAGADGNQVDPLVYKLFLRGIEQPIWVSGDRDDFELHFWGRASDSAYTSENIYLLTATDQDVWWAAGQGTSDFNPAVDNAAGDRDPELQLPNNTFAHQITLEENLLYLPQVDADEHWYWEMLPAPSSKEYSFFVDYLPELSTPEEDAFIRIAIYGSTEAGDVDPDHHLEILVNGQAVADEWWDGIKRRMIDGSFSASVLRNGENTLTITATGDTGVAADIYQLDWIKIFHPRTYAGLDDRLAFTAPSDKAVLSGFSGPVEVYEIESNGYIRQLADIDNISESGGSTFVVETIPGNKYYVTGKAGIKSPGDLSVINIEDEINTLTGAEYIAIGPEDLLEAWQPIMELRQEQGLSVVSMPIKDIYNQYNYSIPEPQAIQKFLREIQSSWEIQPRYIVLLGDSTYDPLGHISSPEANRVPVFLEDTIFGGQTVSDVDFVQLDDDEWPDLPIGLVPARTPGQITRLVDKIIAYERDLDGYINPGIVAIADGQEAHFAREGAEFLALFPDNFQVELFTPPPGSENANQTIKGFMEGSNLFVAYFGHGSVNMWGKDRLFSTEQVMNLEPPQNYPIIVNMTCLTGLYTHPSVESLAEALLWQEGGGAVAVLAPSSLTLPTDQGKLSSGLIKEWLSNPDTRLGDIHMLARQEVPVDRDSSLDVMRTFMLFGDPALRLPNPQ